MAKKYGLSKEQVKFIKAKVLELGSLKAVNAFYKHKDDVSAYARDCAYASFDQDYGDDEDGEIRKEVEVKKTKKGKEPPKMVKRKRKMDAAALDDDYA